jgi:predicted ATP-grasp superfamily ATP-dependent carboligase
MTAHAPILILDGQTNQALACVRTLGRAGYPTLVASHRRRPLAAWSRYCRGRFQLAGQTVAAFGSMREWAHARGTRIVLPLTERACLLCNAERKEWERLGILVGCAPGEVLLGAFDKLQTLRQAEACDVRIPATRCPASLAECRTAADEVGFPCVVKPRFSHAWDGTTFLPDLGVAYVSRAEDLEETVLSRKQRDHWPLIQAVVPGQGKGVFALCRQGEVVAWFAHERLREVRPTGSGSSLRRSIALASRLQAPAERLLAQLAWHGPAMVEFRDDGGAEPYLIEVNGRLWTSLQLAIDAGVDFPRLWAAVLSGEPTDGAPGYETGKTVRWLWGDVKRFLFILAGPPPGYTGAFPGFWQGIRELLGAQPPGTHLEIWQASDPWPAVGEWVEGVGELLARG